jgi:hypothetical protein
MGHLIGVHLSYAYLSHGRVSPIGHLIGVRLGLLRTLGVEEETESSILAFREALT